MKTTLLSILSIMLLGTVSQSAFAQVDDQDDSHTVGLTIPEVALLDLERASTTDITLTFETPEEAGQQIDFSTVSDESVWLNYSSIIGLDEGSATSRKVTVKASAAINDFPADLKVVAAADAGDGDGTIGTPVGTAVTLTDSDQDLITGIGSAYTGSGTSSGHKLTYTVAAKAAAGSYAALRYGTETVTVTYTLSDDTVAL